MSFLLNPNWERLHRDVWNSVEKSVSAPADMYVELLRVRLLKLGRDELDKPENFEALNNPEIAKERFKNLSPPASEKECVSTLESYFDVLQQFGTQVAAKYKEKLMQWVLEHNLRYRVTPDCKMQLTIQGLLVAQYEFLMKSFAGNTHREDAIRDLENSLSKLSDLDEVRNCIRNASNLLEGIVIDKSSIPANSLTSALPGCRGVFPHNSLKQCLENIYKFCSDYPNLRHSGNPASSLRNLKKDDALLMLALTIGFGTFVHNNDASEKILEGSI